MDFGKEFWDCLMHSLKVSSILSDVTLAQITHAHIALPFALLAVATEYQTMYQEVLKN
jgi:hypothetical protein